jgi:hypothetical protein
MRRRAERKLRVKVRADLSFLSALAASGDGPPGGRASEALADASSLRIAEARLAEAATMLKEVRERVRKSLRDNWTKREIDAAIDCTLKATAAKGETK